MNTVLCSSQIAIFKPNCLPKLNRTQLTRQLTTLSRFYIGKKQERKHSTRSFAMGSQGQYEYDLVTIGAGSGGTRASRWSAGQYGVKVAVVELPFGFVSSDTVGGAGGTCVIRGCVPKKLLVYGSHFTEEFQDAKGFGWPLEHGAIDWPHLIQAKSKEVERLNGIYNKILANSGAELVGGRGKLLDAHTVHVDLASGGSKQLTAKNILISTGGRAVKLNIPGVEHSITSDEALALENLPKKSIAIIGGGYIAVEFAGIFNGMGAEVHIFYRKPLPLTGFDEECRAQVANNLSSRGVNVHNGCNPVRIDKLDNGDLMFTYSDGNGAQHQIEVGQVMFATGRKPHIKDLGLETVGVEVDNKSGAIKVDEYSRTNVPNIWAIGDVTDRVNLTPVAIMEGMAFSASAFTEKLTKPDYVNIPSAVFCQPPLATVGLSEEKAIATYSGTLDVYTSSFKPMKYTISGREEKAFMKLLVHKETDKVVGVHMVGPDAAEIMQGMAIALKCGATKSNFDSTVGIHPSSAEEFVTMRTPARTVECKGTQTP
eukprot:TRINITY_DN773_c1_g2_i2.p1 TRINITY_DN773_c1_g2~~TRINITY_DN773_c1_g2_i2.p1  ORF type:complete len:567 (-),score=75.99 TRINITY_DN773_c1_g2_i2:176-1795(-)